MNFLQQTFAKRLIHLQFNKIQTISYDESRGTNCLGFCHTQTKSFVFEYVNLIPYNSVDEHGYQPSTKEQAELFKSELLRLHINVTMRKEHGRDIDGACGQLRAKRSGVK